MGRGGAQGEGQGQKVIWPRNGSRSIEIRRDLYYPALFFARNPIPVISVPISPLVTPRIAKSKFAGPKLGLQIGSLGRYSGQKSQESSLFISGPFGACVIAICPC